MNKIRILTALSKLFGYLVWSISGAFKLLKDFSKRTVGTVNFTQRYDIQVFNNDEQFEVKRRVSHKVLQDIIKSIDVYENMMIMVKKSPEFWNVNVKEKELVGAEEE
tara:strand:+ start:2129 stop:2449 length:321 start_codon:yes stop_codon:yes gene_type:complete